MIRVIAVIEALGLGGAERLLVDVAERLDRRRFEMSVVTLFAERRDYASTLARLGIPETCIRLSSRRDLWRGVARLHRLLLQHPTDLVHTHLFCANIIGRLAARLRRLPVVSTLHAADYEPAVRGGNPRLGRWKQALLRQIDRMSLVASGAHVVAVSEYVAQSARNRLGVPLQRIWTIPNGIDLECFRANRNEGWFTRSRLGIGGERILLLCVGRLSLEKGQDLLLRALTQPSLRELPLEVLLVGEGGARADFERLVAASAFGGHVRFLGARDDVPQLMRAADILVVPSRDEGFGLVLCEAMSSELPVVASRIPAALEIVQDEQTGLLYPAGDTAALAEAVRRLALDADRRHAMGREGRRQAEARFGVGRMIEDLGRLYQTLARADVAVPARRSA